MEEQVRKEGGAKSSGVTLRGQLGTLRHEGASESLKENEMSCVWEVYPGCWVGNVPILTFSPLLPVGPTGPGGPYVIETTTTKQHKTRVMPSICLSQEEAPSRPAISPGVGSTSHLSFPRAGRPPARPPARSALTELPAGPASPKSP